MDEFIITSLEKYDESETEYGELINHKHKFFEIDDSITPISDGRIKFGFDKIFTINSFFIGNYYIKRNIWIWNWCFAFPAKNIQLGKTFINYALNFDENKLKREDFTYLRTILVNSRIEIKNDFNFEILKGIILNIGSLKALVPIPNPKNPDIISYYGIKNPSDKNYI